MYGKDKLADTQRFVRAVLTNQLAKLLPKLYVHLTQQTGRGSEQETAEDIARYFQRCFFDYFRQLQVAEHDIADYISGKRLMELGPGDVPGVALLMYAFGAVQVICVDRFPLLAFSEKNLRVMEILLQSLEAPQRSRGEAAFQEPGKPESGFRDQAIRYQVSRDGISGLADTIDIIYSRAVLEHVNDIDATLEDMAQALRADGIALHLVDLKSHGLHRHNRLDFLTWPQGLWELMYSGKGVPNRWRIDRYWKAISGAGLEHFLFESTDQVDAQEIAEVRPYLAKPFRDLSDQDLSYLGFWLGLRKVSRSPTPITPAS